MPLYSIYFIFFFGFIANLFAQDFNRQIDLYDNISVLYNEKYVEVQNFTNAITQITKTIQHDTQNYKEWHTE